MIPVFFLGSAGGALADGAEAFVGGLLGSAIGTAITNSAQRPREQVIIREPRTIVRHVPVQDPYQREENRRVQTALNYFGFPAGVPDGVMGRSSRAAVANYQVYMGLPASGILATMTRGFWSRPMTGR